MTTRVSYYPAKGGLNQADSPWEIAPGNALLLHNHECTTDGYRRIDGYERFDGQTAPSSLPSAKIDFTQGQNEPAVDGLLYGSASGATGTLQSITGLTGDWGSGTAAGTFNLSPVTGTFTVSDEIWADADGATVVAGTVTQYIRDSETARAAIAAVPGEGPVRGVWVYDGDVYAFRDNVGQTACVMHKASVAGWTTVTTPALLPGGSYEFMNVNFYGTTDTHRMYGVDGVNKGFEFDGTTFSQITTGMTTDTPIHLAEHNNYLVYAFEKGSLQFSPIGEPGGTWTLKTGTASIGTGAEITALTKLTGNTLSVFCDSKILLLSGSSPSDFALEEFSVDTGAVAGTVVQLNLTHFLGPRGLTTLEASQNFGDFESRSFSSVAQPTVSLIEPGTARAISVREKSQYRIMWVVSGASETIGLTFSLANEGGLGFSTFRYPTAMSCTCRGDIDRIERIFFGANDGFVYEADSGNSFDGGEVEAYLALPFNSLKSPRYRKRFRKVVAEVSSPNDVTLYTTVNFDYYDPEYPTLGTKALEGTGGYWDIGQWSEFVWSAISINSAEVKVAGTGKSLGVHIFTTLTHEAPYTIHGLALQYDIRRLER